MKLHLRTDLISKKRVHCTLFVNSNVSGVLQFTADEYAMFHRILELGVGESSFKHGLHTIQFSELKTEEDDNIQKA